jgi:Na+-driven multidrug efflux pump
MDSLAKEILGIAFPSALAVAADPIASLIDTAFIGHLGTFLSCHLDYAVILVLISESFFSISRVSEKPHLSGSILPEAQKKCGFARKEKNDFF